MISTFSSLNGSMLASPRIFFAMADEGCCSSRSRGCIRRSRRRTSRSLLAAVLGMALVMTQTFEQLTDTFVLAIWPFYALSVAAIYTLRKSQPDLSRAVQSDRLSGRAGGLHRRPRSYLVVNALITDPKWTSITFAVVLSGCRCITVFRVQKRSRDWQPSTATVAPLIQLARGDARNATAAPTSSGGRIARTAVPLRRTSRCRRDRPAAASTTIRPRNRIDPGAIAD